MSQQPSKKPERLSIELSEDKAEGVYANLAMIAHSKSEFVIDFIRLMPGLPKARVKSRVIVSPTHAKQLLAALVEDIKKYENTFGNIEASSQDMPSFPINFGTNRGEA